MSEIIPIEKSIENLISQVIDDIQNKLPKNKDGTPVVEIKTIWHIVELTIEIVESIKNKEKFNGSRAKQLTLAALKALINDFAPSTPTNPMREHLLGLLEESIPATIDLVFNASKGKIKINNAEELLQLGIQHKAMLDLDGDGTVTCNDCCILKKLFCCKKR